jgi:predicted nucleic acid-binding protein
VESTCPLFSSPRALPPDEPEISSQTRHGFYDCLYVALAEREGCELVTADQRLINNLGPAFPFIKSLASLP